jgi:hypothetical protein
MRDGAGSMAGLMPIPGGSIYTTSKYAVEVRTSDNAQYAADVGQQPELKSTKTDTTPSSMRLISSQLSLRLYVRKH